jgi:sugar/nucleoside kinase (ribokinase family)
MLGELKKSKVDISHIKFGKLSTGATTVLVDREARRAFLHHIGANGELSPQAIPKDFMGARWLHLGSVFLMPKLPPRSCANLLKRAKEAGLHTSVDVAWDYTGKWDLDKILKYTDVFFFNRDEGEAFAGTEAPLEMVEMVARSGPGITVLKMGKAGCCVKMRTGESFFAPSFDVKAVDSTGAGDAFNAGFVLGMLNALDRYAKKGGKGKKGSKKKPKKGAKKGKGKTKAKGAVDIVEVINDQELKKVALLANALGAISVMNVGGATEPPTQRKLLKFVKTQKKNMIL